MRRLFLCVFILCIFGVLAQKACPLEQPASKLPAGEAAFDVGYSPGNALDLVLKGINEAETSILVAAYSFTSKPVATALLEAHRRGVSVAVLADHKSNGPESAYSAATFLANQGVPVRLNDNYAIFHHKFMVIDSLHVETGSFNYSASAVKRNAENVLFVWNAPALALRYGTEWKRLWNEAHELKARY